ncbi:MAG: mechanosensitive ion channel family protein [Proteobacteria bacterium]|nr:mechanosensitive ion channel family protein [Pseudomonadota bacterium]
MLVLLAIFPATSLGAEHHNPLAVPDLTSPRNAMESFLSRSDRLYTRWADLLTDYLDSGNYYLSPAQHRAMLRILDDGPHIARVLDLSSVPPVLKQTLGRERILQFREILDRIPLPDPADIPDAAAMESRPVKRWRLPGTDIEFVLSTSGPRAGDYVLTPETIERLPDYYQRVKDLPYKSGPAQRLVDTYHQFAPGSNSTVFEIFEGSPIGLSTVLPMRWMLAWPDWSRTWIGGAAAWQWIGIGVGILFGWAFLWLCNRLGRRFAAQAEDAPRRRWHTLPVPIGILLLSALFVPTFATILHLSNTPRIVIAVLATGALYLSAAWIGVAGSAIAGDMIVGAEKLGLRSLDGQLIRLGSRLVGILLAVAALIRGADELGIPAYSVLAGLGVGGLAVALAAKDSLANLLGSMLIMFEKPFRIGHYIKLSNHEGTVEDVGFRSTRIRTPDNSLISIPNDTVINTTVENLTLRPKRRQRFSVGVTYDTPRETLVSFAAAIRAAIEEHELVAPDGIQVSLNALADSSLDILVIFHLAVTDYTAELRGRHDILLRIMELAEEMGVEFAYPTRTLLIDSPADTASRGPARSDVRVPLSVT